MPREGRLIARTHRSEAASDTARTQRPRERLARLGAAALSDAELLTLLVGSGGTTGSARVVAEGLLRAEGGHLRRLAGRTVQALGRRPGVGPATASRIAAAFELGRRAAGPGPDALPAVRGAADVHALMGPVLRDRVQEEFHVLLLDAQHRVVRDVTVTTGILDASLVHPREVLRPAIEDSAAAIILVHNHPSGDPTPSAEDREVTRQMVRAGETVGIPVLDHVIIGRTGYARVPVGWGSGR